ncbi:hypothetical protein [Pontibacter sp. SGAir0037]|uniref:hypothetical protein n=1 Tax=Pontibacter sp. SGAir0037 TaxID=2571030 RepID=UPI0010CD266D|nr:hypothetical protein [Pontibacter sp. SGAir0037]QCR22575.1 hypothetical protein C1N53_09655 [Pontibacter sp. SGAir0037]
MVELNLESLYADAVLQIQYSKSASLLHLTFLKTPEKQQFRNAYKLAIDVALRKGAHYWLSDARQIKEMLPENQGWLVQEMQPLLQSQLRRFAIVMAPECFVMTSPDKVYEKPAQASAEHLKGITKVHFEMDAAFSWLSSEER